MMRVHFTLYFSIKMALLKQRVNEFIVPAHR